MSAQNTIDRFDLFEFEGPSSPPAPSGGRFQIEDRTAFTARNKRLRTRRIQDVYALVLHQTAFSRGNDPKRYDTVTAHFVITPNGRILQLHPLNAYLAASNGFNARSVAVEFVGNFPSTRGRCWEAKRFGCHKLSQEQIGAGRFLIQHLMRTIGLTHVLAHRQSSGTRENDPGPDIWCQVGQWAIDNRGLRDGGPGFKIGSGNPIPDAWRTWCKSGGKETELDEENFEGEDEFELDPEIFPPEDAEDELEDEVNRSSREYIRWVQSALNRILRTSLAVDGIIGSQTRSAIRTFQQRAGLSVDGIVGPQTEQALIAAGAGRPPTGSSSGYPGTPSVPSGGSTPDIVTVRGIQVARQIAGKIEALLSAAQADGVRLSGWGYRSTQRQIELRRAHCGPTQYDIWEKPSSQCKPPTARPGRSMHEQGLAIDFTYNGQSIKTHDNPGFQWLARNAARFGLKNLPSEPWHWSTTGT